MRKKSSILPGMVLVAVGTFLLLDRFNVYIFQWDLMLPVFAGAVASQLVPHPEPITAVVIAPIANLFQEEIKQTFDQKNMFNPGIVFSIKNVIKDLD
ncbi:hypothetical protein IIC68_01310 [archaeon]|nr:hypothetical protein [archaeon]